VALPQVPWIAVAQLLDTLLTHCRTRGLPGPRGRPRTDSTHGLAAIRILNRLDCVVETLRAALHALAVAAPDWLRLQLTVQAGGATWLERYAARAEDSRLPPTEVTRSADAHMVGTDGHVLLAALPAPEAPRWLREVPAVEILRQVWRQQYYVDPAGPVHWRTAAEGLPPSHTALSSPYDAEAHDATKRTTSWIGYKVHLTETCGDAQPHLITHVATTAAPVTDEVMTAPIHTALATRDLLPTTHLVDTGYLRRGCSTAAQWPRRWTGSRSSWRSTWCSWWRARSPSRSRSRSDGARRLGRGPI